MTGEIVKVSRHMTGRVKWYDAEKGYGFVVPDEGGPDVMVHAACVRSAGLTALDEGASVSLAVVRGGLRATYGFGFLLDRNFGNDVFGAPPTNRFGE